MKATVAVGPITEYPSWKWVGEHLIQELPKYFRVHVFDKQPPRADVELWVKRPPVLFRNRKIIYCPIDQFESEKHLQDTAESLRRCSLILSHSERLIPLLAQYAPAEYVDHHGKFSLPKMSNYRESGYCLWIGGFQYVPFLLKWLGDRKLDLKILTDYNNSAASNKAHQTARKMGVPLDIQVGTVNGIPLHEWTEKQHIRMLADAKLAIDIKGSDFNQQHKPPTKAQNYICSGVPLAMNDSESADYFRKRGLKIVTPDDPYWKTPEYHAQTVAFGERLRTQLTAEFVGRTYKTYIERVLHG